MAEHRSDIYHSTQANADGHVDKATLAGMNRRLENQIARFRETTELSRQLALSPEERDLRNAARAGLLRNLGIDETAVARLRASRRQRVRELVPFTDLRHAPYEIPTQQDRHGPPGSLEMWWAQTNWWGNAPITITWQDDGPHFSGAVHVDSDDLQKYSFTILAEFALSADRIPASARGRVLSAPFANVFGWMQANAKDIAMFNFDDQWVKCWLNTFQSVWVTIPGSHHPFFGDQHSWGYRSDSRTIFFLESMDVESTYLPGRIPLPAVEFDLIPQISNVEISLGFRFDMQLEGGDSNLIFGGGRDWPSNVVQTLQWTLEPA